MWFCITKNYANVQNNMFFLTIDFYKYVHYYLFKDVYKFAGKFREVNISKDEKILNGDTVGDYNRIRSYLIYDFMEGNTRTTVIFIIKYLKELGYNINYSLFKEKSKYFRNALARSNYSNDELNIKEDNSHLIKSYENLLLGKNNNLKKEDFIFK